MDLNTVPIRALHCKTRGELCYKLSEKKVLPSPSGLPRDWRGIAHLANIEMLPGDSKMNQAEKILTMWEKCKKATVGRLIDFLQQIDRYDILDDTMNMIEGDSNEYYKQEKNGFIETPLIDVENEKHVLTVADVTRHRNGLTPQIYDAFVLFVDDDIGFATQLIQKLEEDYGLKLCVKDRDLIGGLTFEHEAIMKIISDRCNRLIVILSAAFLANDAHKFFVTFAQSLGIGQGRRKIVPCLYQKCTLPPELSSFFLLDYTRSNMLWNFWEKLRDSVAAVQYQVIPSIYDSPITEKREEYFEEVRADDAIGVHFSELSINEITHEEKKRSLVSFLKRKPFRKKKKNKE